MRIEATQLCLFRLKMVDNIEPTATLLAYMTTLTQFYYTTTNLSYKITNIGTFIISPIEIEMWDNVRLW